MLKIFFLALSMGLVLLTSQAVFADTEQRRQAKRIHDRLTGTPPSKSVLAEMETLLTNDPSGKSAAEKALQDPAFYNVTLKNFATPWTNEQQTVFAPLNDYTATVIGMIRDDIDFRELLSGDILYTGDPAVVVDDNSQSVSYSNFTNDHYVTLDNLGPETGNLGDESILIQQTQSAITGLDTAATAGIMTTRAAARAFFFKGTSRAMFRFTFLNHLCTDLEAIKDNSRIPDRVTRDVSRSPGGDSRIFLNSCVGCHAGMDGLMGAYAFYDLDFVESNDIVDETTPHLIYTPGEVQAKFLINANNFKPGHVTVDDRWINYWRNGQNALLGWTDNYAGFQQDEKGHAFGNGAKTMGRELANSEAFAQCQVEKVFQNVCLREPGNTDDRAQVSSIVTDFKTDGYKMKQVFRDVAAYCKGS